ncbi:MAG TPA: methyl-accepting chemotaxis protein [bacterium]|nr:methyl-accepting chemotaxis protein [bacterium]HOL47168.1 methyl-accepting chemotaxis protein [bacterium]HPQ18091.1 methyl-accepting chemotaxis protein [bacterium]
MTYIITFDVIVAIIFSLILSNFNIHFLKDKILLICEIFNKNDSNLLQKSFPENIYETANFELSYIFDLYNEAINKQAKENEFLEKKILQVMEDSDNVSANTKKTIKKVFYAFKIFDTNNNEINKLKEEVNKLKENISIVKSNRYSFKDINEAIEVVQGKLNSVYQRVEIFIKNIELTKKEEEENIDFISSLKNTFKNFYDIIEDIELIAVNASIEASRVEESQAFIIFAKDLQLAVSKLANEIQQITDRIQKFQIRETDFENIISLIEELKEEYKNLNLVILRLTQDIEILNKQMSTLNNAIEVIENKIDNSDEILKQIDFKTVQTFKSNIESITDNMNKLEDIYTQLIEIKKRRI